LDSACRLSRVWALASAFSAFFLACLAVLAFALEALAAVRIA
jgi:hypothetical protein